jgi:hypothetical protein
MSHCSLVKSTADLLTGLDCKMIIM